MKTKDFQNLLLRSVVSAIACDDNVDDVEIDNLKKMADNEIFFMGFDYQKPFSKALCYIKDKGKFAINEYLDELSEVNLNENQELLLIEIIINVIESDEKIEPNEIEFLQLVKSKLKMSEETLITKFPQQINYLIDSDSYGSYNEFTADIFFE